MGSTAGFDVLVDVFRFWLCFFFFSFSFSFFFLPAYLQHTDCYRETSQDWLHCQVIFERLVAYEMQLPNATDEDRNLALCW